MLENVHKVILKCMTQYTCDCIRTYMPAPILLLMSIITNNVFTTQGTVIIIANHGERIDIPHRTLLENKIVSGNLRIRDH